MEKKLNELLKIEFEIGVCYEALLTEELKKQNNSISFNVILGRLSELLNQEETLINSLNIKENSKMQDKLVKMKGRLVSSFPDSVFKKDIPERTYNRLEEIGESKVLQSMFLGKMLPMPLRDIMEKSEKQAKLAKSLIDSEFLLLFLSFMDEDIKKEKKRDALTFLTLFKYRNIFIGENSAERSLIKDGMHTDVSLYLNSDAISSLNDIDSDLFDQLKLTEARYRIKDIINGQVTKIKTNDNADIERSASIVRLNYLRAALLLLNEEQYQLIMDSILEETGEQKIGFEGLDIDPVKVTKMDRERHKKIRIKKDNL